MKVKFGNFCCQPVNFGLLDAFAARRRRGFVGGLKK